MCFFNKSSFVCVMLFIAVSAVFADEARPCNRAYKCSSEEAVVWATDNKLCIPFRNGCQLANENCQRQNSYTEVLKEVTKEECQKLCSDICTMEFRPVCAEYNGKPSTFGNPCALTNHICNTGETYSLYREGECQTSA